MYINVVFLILYLCSCYYFFSASWNRQKKYRILEVWIGGRFLQRYYGLLWSSEKRLCRASSDFCRRFYPGSRRPWFTNAPAKFTKDGGGAVVKDEILPPRCGGNKIETRSASSNAKQPTSQPAGWLASQSKNQPAENTCCLYVSPCFFFVPVLSSIYRGLYYSRILHPLHTVCRLR